MTARSGSESRQRTQQVGVRLTPDEMAKVTAHAEAAGVSLSEYLRMSALPDPEQAVREAWQRGYVDGHRQACPGPCAHGVMRNPYSRQGATT